MTDARPDPKFLVDPKFLTLSFYVTPQQRHAGEAEHILERRKQVIKAAKAKNPLRWSGATRNLSLPESVTLNPDTAANC